MSFYEAEQGNLASRTMVLDTKKFHLDVTENQRGRFLKIVEVSNEGRKNQILMTFPAAKMFNNKLDKFIDTFNQLDGVNPNNLKQGELLAEVMNRDEKKYHMDLKENARGRFLKVSETFSSRNFRSQVFIPAEGMEELQNHLVELIEQFDDGIDSGDSYNESSGGGGGNSYGTRGGREDSKQVRIENKNFYFDVKSNAQGCYMAISEVNGSHRNSILIPQSGWQAFKAALDDTVRDNDH